MASHLVIGELSYTKLASGNNYEITLTYYRDCRPASLGGGNPSALQQDDPVYISIFQGSNLFITDSIYSFQNENLSFATDCRLQNNPVQCINKLVFKKTVTLPPSSQPYTIINQRCCLNESIENVISPGNTGFSFVAVVPSGITNSSAVFKPAYSNIICVHDNVTVDHSATDPDGDSLSYSFCEMPMGGDPSDPKPLLSTLPTLFTIPLDTGYTVTQPMHQMYINPVTGQITLEPSQVGHFLVCICCQEWRNGVLINTTRRAFVYQVNDCNMVLNANIPCDINVLHASSGNICSAYCNENRIVTFENNSTSSAAYHWDFGIDSLQSDTSSLRIPSYQFPSNGYYTITLTTTLNGCTDVAQQTIYVGNDSIHANYTLPQLPCTGLPISLHDQSTSLNDTISQVQWFLSTGLEQQILTGLDTAVTLTVGDSLHIIQTVFNSKGCYDTTDRFLSLYQPSISVFSDTTVNAGTAISLYASGASVYHWSFMGANNIQGSTQGSIITPSTQYPGITNYIVHGADDLGCVGINSVKVMVTTDAQFIVPNAFTPNADGINDWLSVLHSGYELKSFKVFNRWGQEVFSTKDINFKWNGEFNAQPLAMDTYYWVAQVYNQNEMLEVKKGDVVIIR